MNVYTAYRERAITYFLMGRNKFKKQRNCQMEELKLLKITDLNGFLLNLSRKKVGSFFSPSDPKKEMKLARSKVLKSFTPGNPEAVVALIPPSRQSCCFSVVLELESKTLLLLLPPENPDFNSR